MAFLWIGLGLGLILLALVLGLAYYCYRSAFFFDRRIQRDPEEFDLPHGTVYEPFYDHMIEKMKEAGFSEKEMEMICTGNWFDLIKRVVG